MTFPTATGQLFRCFQVDAAAAAPGVAYIQCSKPCSGFAVSSKASRAVQAANTYIGQLDDKIGNQVRLH
jgi:hypothetical protein